MECNNEIEENCVLTVANTDVDVLPIDINKDETTDELRLEESSEPTENVDTDALIDSLIESHFNTSTENDTSITHSDNASGNDLSTINDDVEENDAKDNQNIIPQMPTAPKPEKLCHLPLGSVKRIVKSDPDVTLVSAESIFLISKATELFLQWLGKEVHSYTVRQKKKTIQIRDLNSAISEIPALQFLDGALD